MSIVPDLSNTLHSVRCTLIGENRRYRYFTKVRCNAHQLRAYLPSLLNVSCSSLHTRQVASALQLYCHTLTCCMCLHAQQLLLTALQVVSYSVQHLTATARAINLCGDQSLYDTPPTTVVVCVVSCCCALLLLCCMLSCCSCSACFNCIDAAC
jgi:hypothetical protein